MKSSGRYTEELRWELWASAMVRVSKLLVKGTTPRSLAEAFQRKMNGLEVFMGEVHEVKDGKP